MDEIAGRIDEKVIMQIGNTKYKPKNAEYFNFKNYEKIQKLNKRARIVVCHGGAGTIITALEQGTPVIAVPRLKKFGEALSDHQLDIVNELAKDMKIIAVNDIEHLEKTILNFDGSQIKTDKEKSLVIKLREYIFKLSKSATNQEAYGTN